MLNNVDVATAVVSESQTGGLSNATLLGDFLMQRKATAMQILTVDEVRVSVSNPLAQLELIAARRNGIDNLQRRLCFFDH